MALAPFNMVFGPLCDPFDAFIGGHGPHSRGMRAANMDNLNSALMPTFELPLHQGVSTAMDIIDSEKAITVTADAPGFEPEDVKIELKDNMITISGRKNEEKKQEQDGKVVRRERTSVSFCRSFALPDNIREDDVSASLDKGVLTVTIPKAEPTPKPQPRRIAVQGVQATDAHQVAPAAPQEAGEGQAEAAAQE